MAHERNLQGASRAVFQQAITIWSGQAAALEAQSNSRFGGVWSDPTRPATMSAFE